jgi:tRNA(Ile)-lysidine synthase
MAHAVELLLFPLRDALVLESDSNRVVLDRDAFLTLDDPIGREFFRKVANSLGIPPTETGTAIALEFMRRGVSGKTMIVDGALLIGRDFGMLTLAKEESGARSGRESSGVESPPVSIPGPEEGQGELVLLGRRFEIRWGDEPPGDGWEWLALPGEGLHLPLVTRGWKPGDRMRTQSGEKKLKKLFLELRIPVRERARTPLLVDATGEVLWIAGWKSSGGISTYSSQPPHWGVGIRPVDEG